MKNTIEFRWLHDEECIVSFDGGVIMSVNHTDHGWHGMTTILKGFEAMALIGNFPLIVTGEPGV